MKKIPMPAMNQWLDYKSRLIGGSEIASLFNGLGYKTPLQIWMEKTGRSEAENLDGVIPVMAGQLFEDRIAQLAEKVFDIELIKSESFYMDEERKTCASLDYLLKEGDELVPCELKFLGRKSRNNQPESSYIDTEEEGVYLPPVKFCLQVQWQMFHTGAPFGYLIAMVGNSELIANRIERDQELIDQLLEVNARFWESVANNTPPTAIAVQDYDAVMRLYSQVNETKTLQQFSVLETEALLNEYLEVTAAAKQADDRKKSIKMELLEIMGDAIKLETNVANCSAKINKYNNRTLRVTQRKSQ